MFKSNAKVMSKLKFIFLLHMFLVSESFALSDPGKWDKPMSSGFNKLQLPKSLFAGSKIYVQIFCEGSIDSNISIHWTLEEILCSEEETADDTVATTKSLSSTTNKTCKPGGHILLEEYKVVENNNNNPSAKVRKSKDTGENEEKGKGKNTAASPNAQSKEVVRPVFQITKDGMYIYELEIKSNDNHDFNVTVHIEMKGTYGYLSARDWPLLPFYGVMCLVYVFLGIIWLVVSFLQWRDLLRIQFWIGGVILLGMLEKAMFYAEFQNLNSNGVSTLSVVLAAEWVSCAKRTLARMLVIIVSLGFGIVKPRLGSMLHRVVGTGTLYFVLASVESYLRVTHDKNDPTNQNLVAGIPLAVLDSAICWWIFTSLVQTTRTLRLRRNMVKLSLYRHFTNTLIFSVIASVIFMLYSIKTHHFAQCLTDWKESWVDEAFWHVLFSLLLLVIMILWRPTNNNQRYAFTPLLDNPEDEDDDEEEDQFVADAYGVKMRGNRSASPKPSKSGTTEEDDLRWVEENIPAAIADAALPILDSDEEIISTKFEVSKMQ